LRWGALGLAGFVAVAAPVLAYAPVASPVSASDLLPRLERGRWAVRNADTGAERSLCLGPSSALVQLEHRGLSCPHEVLARDGSGATVSYTCRARGFGHTRLRIETTRLLQIETQGMIDGRPFDYRAVATKTGTC
jgi:hypothetical protein